MTAPRYGLMQPVPARSIFDPVANVRAGISYVESRRTPIYDQVAADLDYRPAGRAVAHAQASVRRVQRVGVSMMQTGLMARMALLRTPNVRARYAAACRRAGIRP